MRPEYRVNRRPKGRLVFVKLKGILFTKSLAKVFLLVYIAIFLILIKPYFAQEIITCFKTSLIINKQLKSDNYQRIQLVKKIALSSWIGHNFI